MIELALNLLVATSMLAGALLFAAGFALGFRARQREDLRAFAEWREVHHASVTPIRRGRKART